MAQSLSDLSDKKLVELYNKANSEITALNSKQMAAKIL